MRKTIKLIVSIRIIILAVLGALTYLTTAYFNISLWYILLFGIGTGVIFGKVFCRSMCPIGFVMELMFGKSGQFASMYQYHKMGCPIAWVSGWLNKFSVFKIKLNENTCLDCGICDKKCYIVAMEPAKYSLYKPAMTKPGESYTCSKCLECVASCPNGSLTYKL